MGDVPRRGCPQLTDMPWEKHDCCWEAGEAVGWPLPLPVGQRVPVRVSWASILAESKCWTQEAGSAFCACGRSSLAIVVLGPQNGWDVTGLLLKWVWRFHMRYLLDIFEYSEKKKILKETAYSKNNILFKSLDALLVLNQTSRVCRLYSFSDAFQLHPLQLPKL